MLFSKLIANNVNESWACLFLWKISYITVQLNPGESLLIILLCNFEVILFYVSLNFIRKIDIFIYFFVSSFFFSSLQVCKDRKSYSD